MSNLLFERRGHVALLTLNRPEKHNAMDFELQTALADAWEEFNEDDNLRVAIITGAGEKAFSAGADLATAAPAYVDASKKSADKRTFVPNSPKPLIAAINGYCIAGALALVLRCDIRIGSTNASIGGTGAKLGLFPAGQCTRMARLIPPSKTMYMLMQASYLDAQEAYDCGLFDRLVAPEDLLPTALEVAERIAANAPLVVQGIKRAVLQGLEIPLRDAERLENEIFKETGKTEDGREGLAAWAERRKPVFTGR